MDKKLFIVEFGKPEASWPNSVLHVVASSFDEAVEKAKTHLESKKPEVQSIINEHGDLVMPRDQTIQVRGVKVVAEEIIW